MGSMTEWVGVDDCLRGVDDCLDGVNDCIVGDDRIDGSPGTAAFFLPGREAG